MLVTVKYKIRYELLELIGKRGITPDTIDQVLVMRMKDMLRQNKIKHDKIKVDITKNYKFLTRLFEVAIYIINVVHDIEDLSIKIIESAKPYMLDIEDINITIVE